MTKKKSKQGANLKKGKMDGDRGRRVSHQKGYISRAKTGIKRGRTPYGSRKNVKKYKPRKKS